MKAWIVSPKNPVEGCSVVRFAPSRAKAIYAGLGEIRDHGEADEFIEVQARRFKAMDGRDGNPPTLRELVEEHGWHTRCCDCQRSIDCDGADRWEYGESDGPQYEAVAWFGDLAWCAGCVPERYRSGAVLQEGGVA